MANNFDTESESVREGLDLFAAAWLEQWASSGGEVCLQPDGSMQISYLMFDESLIYTEADDENRVAGGFRYQSYLFSDGRYTGRLHALSDLLRTVPGGRTAVKAHMLSHGLRQYYSAGASA